MLELATSQLILGRGDILHRKEVSGGINSRMLAIVLSKLVSALIQVHSCGNAGCSSLSASSSMTRSKQRVSR